MRFSVTLRTRGKFTFTFALDKPADMLNSVEPLVVDFTVQLGTLT